MDKEQVLALFRSTGALLEGHFILTSGWHSATYFQCARVLQYPAYLISLCQEIAEHFRECGVSVVMSPAIGGVVVGTEVGRQLGVRSIFAERKLDSMVLRRGFQLQPEDQVLIVEDVITTGGSVRELITIVREQQARLVGIGTIVDRSGGKVKLHARQFAVLEMETVSYAPEEIPAELAGIPVSKPGSRGNY